METVDKKEVPVREYTVGNEKKKGRSSSTKHLQVFICGEQLTVDFFSPISSVTIIVRNISTDKVAFFDVYSMPGGAIIDLSNEGAGEYQVRFTLPFACLLGDFSIK